jgi:hypothetical protein
MPPRDEPGGPEAARIQRLVGVYDADHTVRGELTYWVGARLGRSHCALCDITHGVFREREDWRRCRAGLPVAFDTYHRDDQPDAVRAVVQVPPAVVAETDQGLTVLLGPDQLADCDGSVEELAAAIEVAVEAAGLAWPDG